MRRWDLETMKGNIGPGLLRIQRFFEGREINGNAMKKAEAAEGVIGKISEKAIRSLAETG